MTKHDAEQLARDAESDAVRQRDTELEEWLAEYERRHPRPEGSVNVTQPGA